MNKARIETREILGAFDVRAECLARVLFTPLEIGLSCGIDDVVELGGMVARKLADVCPPLLHAPALDEGTGGETVVEVGTELTATNDEDVHEGLSNLAASSQDRAASRRLA